MSDPRERSEEAATVFCDLVLEVTHCPCATFCHWKGISKPNPQEGNQTRPQKGEVLKHWTHFKMASREMTLLDPVHTRQERGLQAEGVLALSLGPVPPLPDPPPQSSTEFTFNPEQVLLCDHT